MNRLTQTTSNRSYHGLVLSTSDILLTPSYKEEVVFDDHEGEMVVAIVVVVITVVVVHACGCDAW